MKVKKNGALILNILTWVLVAFTIVVMIFTVISVNTVGPQKKSLFGFRGFIVLSDSMQDTFQAGDIVVSKEVTATSLQAGDIISFISTDGDNYGAVVTHKIREVTTDENGALAFRTYGTATDENDRTLVSAGNILGKYSFRLPGAGHFFQYLKTPVGYILFILIPFAILLLIQGMQCVRIFRKYRAEQQTELRAEREKIAAERQAAKQMMEELQYLRQQMNEATPSDVSTEKKETDSAKNQKQNNNEQEQ